MQISTEYDNRWLDATEAQVLFKPRSYRANQSRLGVVLCSQHGGAPKNFIEPTYRTLPDAIASAGMPVAIPSTRIGGVDGVSWGNNQAKQDIDEMRVLYLQSASVLNCRQDKIGLVGISMGAFQALNWAVYHIPQVAGISLIVPGLALDNAYNRNLFGTARAEIEAAYGGPSPYLGSLYDHSPTYYAEYLTGVPIRIWYAPDDDVAWAAFVEDFATRVGPSCTIHSLGNVGHNVTAAPVNEVAAWMAECERNSLP